MCMLAEIFTISMFMAYTIVCMIFTYSIEKQLVRKLPKYMTWTILSSYIVFIAITLVVWIFAHDYVYAHMEKVARFMLGV